MDTGVNTCIWAKLSRDEPKTVHPLVCHLLDTGSVAQEIWHRSLGDGLREWLASAFGLDQSAAGQWFAFWAALHDIGKATPAFQVKAERTHAQIVEFLRLGGLGFDHADTRHHHTVLGAAILEVILRKPIVSWTMDDCLANDIATTISGHHGSFPLPNDSRGLGYHIGSGPWVEERRRLVGFLADRWRIGGLPRPQRPSAQTQAAYVVLAGLVSVADWIASCEGYFPYEGQGLDLEAYVTALPGKARTALECAGWHQWQAVPGPCNFHDTFKFKPHEMQRRAIRAAAGLSAPGLILIEAPMGLGKTEAALAIASDCLGRFDHQGVYIALPTQATSNQMFARFHKFAPHLIADGRVNLQLLHGQKTLNNLYNSLRLRVGGGEDSDDGTVVAEEWFAAGKRGLLAPLGVGTIDQGLFGILQTRHFFVRLFGLAGKVVILDEVHAYDTYTSRLLEHLVAWLGRLGCTVVLLSATLPIAKRRKLIEAYTGADPGLAQEAQYPRITVGGAGESRSIGLRETPQRSVGVECIPSAPAEIARRLEQALAGGGCAACICNTVERAQEVFRAVRDRLGGQGFQLDLLHARFPLGQRKEKENRVVAQFGKEGWRKIGQDAGRPCKAMLVATQVIEQSLDLDFDLMVTDLAPVDLVLQRAGRLHRHEKVDGGLVARLSALSAPRLLVAVPEVGPDGLPRFGLDRFVYEPYVLLRSYLALVSSGLSAVRIPEDVEGLIEQVYGETAPFLPGPTWEGALAAALAGMQRTSGADTFVAESRLIPVPNAPDGVLEEFNQGLRDDDELAARWGGTALTRNSRESVTLVCLHQVAGRLCLDPEGKQPVDTGRRPSPEETVALVHRSVAISRAAVVWHFRENHPDPPSAWRRIPVLRHCRPLPLEAGAYRIGSLTVRLDEDLGIALERLIAEPSEGDSNGILVQPR